MAKEIAGIIKLQIKGGAANPSPPVGPALGSKGINIMEFCKQFNARTKEQQGLIIPALITIYQDHSFTFELKSPPASVLLKRSAGLAKGSAVPNKDKVGKVTKSQVIEIAKLKQKDLNSATIEAAARMVEGSARSMGIDVIP